MGILDWVGLPNAWLPSPIGLISLFAIVRPRIGGLASSVLAANALRSMLGFGMMHLAILPREIATALIVVLLVLVFWPIALLLLRRWKQFG